VGQHLVVRLFAVTLVEALDREWRELIRDHRTALARWADRHGALAPCQSLDDIVSVAKQNSDPVLAALLTEVSLGDQLAARVVLQTLIGRMVRMALRDPRSSIEDYVAALWCVINSYPLGRRPVRIAANLSMDTLRAISDERRWLRRGDVTLSPSSEALEELLEPVNLDGSRLNSLPPVDVEVRQVLEAGMLLSVIDNSDALLLHSIYADGFSGDRAARRFHTSEGTVRIRCSKAVRRLAAHAVELADAAA
jgi:hypothetical protein